jgi:hypothetical protein
MPLTSLTTRSLRLAVPGVLTLAALGLAACGSDAAATTSGGATAQSSASGTEAPAAGEAGNGEAAGVRFVSPRFHYRIDAPGQMTEAADGTASSNRGVEQLSVRVVTGTPAKDASAFAQSDLATVQGQGAQFRLLTPLGTPSVNGRPFPKFVYSTSGVNPVTGKAEDLVNARYYISRDSGTLAVVTYSIVASQYDPQGADDVVSTFQWQ